MKYAPGLMVGQLSGKAGSTVASRNRNGSYFRTRVIPVKVENAATGAVRANFTELAQGYRALTQAQRDAWTSFGGGISRNNSLGISYNLTGLQAYEYVNRNLTTTGQPIVADPPQQLEVEGLTSVSLSITSDDTPAGTSVTTGATSATQIVGSTADMQVGDELVFQNTGFSRFVQSITDATHVVLTESITTVDAEGITIAPNGRVIMTFAPSGGLNETRLAIFATPQLSAGISRPTKNAFRLIQVLPTATPSPLNITPAYVGRFGAIATGMKIFVRAKPINLQGLAGTPIENVGIAVAP